MSMPDKESHNFIYNGAFLPSLHAIPVIPVGHKHLPSTHVPPLAQSGLHPSNRMLGSRSHGLTPS